MKACSAARAGSDISFFAEDGEEVLGWLYLLVFCIIWVGEGQVHQANRANRMGSVRLELDFGAREVRERLLLGEGELRRAGWYALRWYFGHSKGLLDV